MLDYSPAFTVVLGGAFAVSYWTIDAVTTVFEAVDRAVLLGVGGIMVFSWTIVAGYTSLRTLRTRDDLLEETLKHILLWVVSFGGVVILVTRSLGAVLVLVWSKALETTFWFGMVTVTTILTGALSIGVAGIYATVISSHR